MSKFLMVFIGALALIWVAAACDAIPFVAQNEPTATPTRTRRPTFTPKPPPTDTPEVTSTDVATATDEPQPTDESTATEEPATRAPTKRPVAVSAPKATEPPPPPPKPQFAVSGNGKLCPQDGIYEVVVNVKRGSDAVGGVYYGAFDQGGRLLQDGAGKNLIGVTDPAYSQGYGSNCNQSYDTLHPNTINGKLDVGDVVRRGTNPVIFRFINSPTDLTPTSPDFAIDFGTGGRYWLYAQSR